MPSEAFKKFHFHYIERSFGAMREGTDPDSLLMLQGDERKEAEKLLREAFEDSYGDERAVAGLGTLRVSDVVDEMKQRLQQNQPQTPKIALLMALHNIDQSPTTLTEVLKILNNPEEKGDERYVAVHALGAFETTHEILSTIVNAMLFDGYSGLISATSQVELEYYYLRHDDEALAILKQVPRPRESNPHEFGDIVNKLKYHIDATYPDGIPASVLKSTKK